MKNRNWFWGLFFLVSAVFVVASQLGVIGNLNLGFWSIAVTVLLIALFVSSIFERNFFGMLLPLAFLYMIYWKPLHWPEVNSWLLLLSVVLASIGLHILFRRTPSFKHYHDSQKVFCNSSECIDDNHPSAKVSFGSSSKYLHGDCIENGQFSASFGELQVFFDQSQLSPAGAEIFVDCSFGSIVLHIPRSWRVIDKVHASMGAVENNAPNIPLNEAVPSLTLSGNVQFGNIGIVYN